MDEPGTYPTHTHAHTHTHTRTHTHTHANAHTHTLTHANTHTAHILNYAIFSPGDVIRLIRDLMKAAEKLFASLSSSSPLFADETNEMDGRGGRERERERERERGRNSLI